MDKPRVTSMCKDGVITILIGKKEYIYSIDSAKHDHFIKLSGNSPWRGLNFLKINCRWGGKGVMKNVESDQ